MTDAAPQKLKLFDILERFKDDRDLYFKTVVIDKCACGNLADFFILRIASKDVVDIDVEILFQCGECLARDATAA